MKRLPLLLASLCGLSGYGAVETSAHASSDASTNNKTASTADVYAQAAAVWYETVYAVSFVEGDESFFDYYPAQAYIDLGDDPGFYENADLPAKIDAYIAPWVAAGWSKTELHSVSAKPISENAALITAHWIIQTADGENVTGCALPAWRYVVVGSGDSRRVIAEFEAPCADA